MKQYLLREYYELCEGGICQDFLTESEKIQVKNGAMFLTGVMQRADAKNGNGRVYPRHILKREVENYKKLIGENRALGECVPEDTEILTSDGWKKIQNISDQEIIFTLNLDSNEIELQQIEEKVKKPYNDDLVRIYGRNFDSITTKNHLMVLWDRKGQPYSLEAIKVKEMIENGDSRINHSCVKKSGEWSREEVGYFQIGSKTVKAEDWMAFLGIYISEGHSSGTKGGKAKNIVGISQTKEETKKKIQELLSRMPFNFVLQGNNRQWVSTDSELYQHLFALGNSHQKYIPTYAKNTSKKLLNILLDWMLLGDGRNRKDKKGNIMRELCTTSTKLVDDTTEIMFKLGSGSSIRKQVPKDRFIEGRKILAENSKPVYTIRETTVKGHYLDSRMIKTELIPHNGDVYCVRVPNKTWLMRINGKTMWTHNCDHPDESVINLKNVSHMVTDIWWNGDDVMGKIKILDTPSGRIIKDLINGGVTLGISSRAMGSVKEAQGITMVEDDLQLICFDLVAEPSTNKAFMYMTEAKNRPLTTKGDRLNRLLNEIVGE